LFLAWKRHDDALACLQTSLALAQRLRDELRMGGAWYLLARYHEDVGNLEETAAHLERVIRVDKKYELPKLEENMQRLETMRARLVDPIVTQASSSGIQAHG